MSVDYTLSALERITSALVDSHLQKGIEFADIVFSDAATNTMYPGFNARTVAKCFRNNSLSNCIAIYVHRDDLNTFFTDNSFLNINTAGLITTHDLLPVIFNDFGIKLTEEDIVLENLADTNDTITATIGSIGWTGSFQFNATVEVYPPLIRSNSNRLLFSHSGKFIRRSIPAYNP